MHKKFLRTLTLVFMQGVLFWSLGLQESAAMDARIQLEVEKKRYLKILKDHDSTFSRHKENDGSAERKKVVSEEELQSGVPLPKVLNGCGECYTAAKHYVAIHMTLEPDSARTSCEATKPIDENFFGVYAPGMKAMLKASCERGRTAAGFQTFCALRQSYSAVLKTLDAHNDFFSTHTKPRSRYDEKVKKTSITEHDLINFSSACPLGNEDERNCSVCYDAIHQAKKIINKLIPDLDLNRLQNLEAERMDDPARANNSTEKFAALIKLARNCWHHPPGGYIKGKHSKHPSQDSKINQSILSLKPDMYDIPCSICKGHVHDAIQVLLSDPELSEKTTKQYREEEEKLLLKAQEKNRYYQEAREKEAAEKNELEKLQLAAKDGTADAQYALGVHLSPSTYCTPSALPWFRLAADQGHKGAQDRVSTFIGEEKSAEEASLRQTYASLASCRDCAPHTKKEYSSVPRITCRTVPGQPYGSFGQIGLPTTVTDTTWVTQTTETPVPSRNIPKLNTILATVLEMKVNPSYNVRPDEVKTTVGCTFCDPLLKTAFLQLYKSRQSPDDIEEMSVRVYKKTFGQ